jgi:hypothetical protein
MENGMGISLTGVTVIVWTAEQQKRAEDAGFKTKFVDMKPQPLTEKQMAWQKYLDEQSEIGNDPSKQMVGVIADNDARNLWGEVVKNGKIIARIYNSGGVETERANVQLDPDASTSERAQQVLDQLGGELVMAKSRRDYYTSRHLVPTCDWLGVVW